MAECVFQVCRDGKQRKGGSVKRWSESLTAKRQFWGATLSGIEDRFEPHFGKWNADLARFGFEEEGESAP